MAKDKDSLKKSKAKKAPKAQAFFLTCLLVLMLGNYFWPRDEITQTKLAVARWPLSTKKNLKLAEVLFNNNYESQAIEEFKKGEKLYQLFSFLRLNQKTQENLKETKKLVYSCQKIKEKISYWETVLKTKPYCRDGLLQLAALNYQLKEDKKARQYWEKAFYLDPNNYIVQQVGQIINQ